MPGSEGYPGTSTEKRAIPMHKGAPRMTQASDLCGKPTEIKTIAGHITKYHLQCRYGDRQNPAILH